MNRSETDLIKRLRERTEGAETEFVKTFAPVVERYLRKTSEAQILSRLELEEILMEVLVRALRVLKGPKRSLEGSPPSIRSLLKTLIPLTLEENKVIRKIRMPMHFDTSVLPVRDTAIGMPSFLGEERSQFLFVEATFDLTPEFLETHLVPYLKAVVSMQHLCSDILGKPAEEIRIRSLQQRSPISISLQGASDAVNSIKDMIIPWRRRNAKKIADLNVREAELEIKKKEGEIRELQAKTARTRAEAKKLEAEAVKLRQEQERESVETDRARFELQSDKLQLASAMVRQIGPDLTDAERRRHAIEMLRTLDVLATGPVEIMNPESPLDLLER